MPIATIELNDGRRVKLEVPEGATQEQIGAFVQQNLGKASLPIPDDESLPALPGSALEKQRERLARERIAERESQPKPSAVETMVGSGDAALTMASGVTTGAFGQIGGTIEGLLKEVLAGNFGTKEAADRIEALAIQRAGEFTRSPRTEEGARQLGVVAEVLEPLSAVPPIAEAQLLANAARSVRMPSNLGHQIIGEDGLPTKQLSTSLKERGMTFGDLITKDEDIPMFLPSRTPDEFVDDVIKSKLKAGDSAASLYKFKLDDKGRVVDDDLGKLARRNGFLEGDIASAKGANDATKAEMIKMLRAKRQIQSDSSKALDFRPTDTVGNSAMKRFSFLQDEAKRLRGELDAISGKPAVKGKNSLESDRAGGYLSGREISPDKVVKQYAAGLDDLGVKMNTDTIPPKLDFTNSLISEDKTSQRILKSVTNILSKGGDIDARDAHLVKRQLDTMLDFNKKSATGLTDAGEKFAKGIRRSINESIRDVSPRYARVNDELSSILDSLNDFSDSLGRVDPFADNAKAAVGQTLRRLLSNVQSRSDLDSALTKLDDTAKSFGGSFDTDIKRLIMFNKTLDERFGATARGSLQGELESAIRSTTTTGPIKAAKEFAVKKGSEKIDEIRGIGDEEAFNTMERILKRRNQ